MNDFGLLERVYWLIRLRWLAVIGVILTILFARYVLDFSLPVFRLYTVSFILAVYNLIFLGWLNFCKDNTKYINRIANSQISLDLLSLAALIHFSGGIENPFIFYFIFHMIIASILLSRRASFLQATFAVLLLCLLVSLECLDILPHYCLERFIINDQHNNIFYISGVLFVFVSTLYIAVYLATSISARLREREKSLKEANTLLNEKDRIKSEYVLRVSHDIKEHLSAIQSCVEPVALGITGSLNPQQSDLLQRANERTGKLLFFVRALLEITRIKLSRQIEMRSFSLPKTVENALNFVASGAKSKNIRITCQIDKTIEEITGAEVYIEETIANILANSVKYTAPNGKIDISLVDKGNSVLIQIKDTGIGIPKDELPRIFEEFFRASNARAVEKNGTGLGLSIAKQVVDMHKGKIWIESEEGRGTTFYIILPKS